MYQRAIYCNFEDAMVSKWSTAELTTCPNDAGHSVNLESTIIENVARLTLHLGSGFSTSSTSYVDVSKFIYQGSDYYAIDDVPPKYLKIRASVVAGTYDLRVIDSGSNTLWSSTGNSGSSEQVITMDFDTISVPSSEAVLTLQVKTSGSAVTINNSSVFSAFVDE